MQIITNRAGSTTIKLTKTEQGVLRRAASIIRQIGRNVEVGAAELMLVSAKHVDMVAGMYGPMDEAAPSGTASIPTGAKK